MNIAEALAALDPTNDEHWTKDGKPAMKAVEALVGSSAITREDVELANPGFVRPDTAGKPEPEMPSNITTEELRKAQAERREVEGFVLAVITGFWGGQLRRAGSRFWFRGIPGSWMVADDKYGQRELEKAKEEHDETIVGRAV